ncbi:MAG: hypothetical protein AB7G80_03605 [Dongiaceae bacterium]
MIKNDLRKDMKTLIPAGIDFVNLGVNEFAYLRPVKIDGIEGVGIHTADGKLAAFAATEDQARSAISEHNLNPVSLH